MKLIGILSPDFQVRFIIRQMIKLSHLAIAIILSPLGCHAFASPTAPRGQMALQTAFDPSRNFAGDLVPSSADELVLTASASARDDYAPAYSLAIAYRCTASEKSGERRCGFTARLLSTGSTTEERQALSLRLAAQARFAKSAAEVKTYLDKAEVQWLEADVGACPNGIFAMDSVRVADWRPDIHYALQPVQDREIIMHPASIRVRMSGTYTTSTYQGWVLAAGVPAAVQQLMDTLQPCWKPATSLRPWDRP